MASGPPLLEATKFEAIGFVGEYFSRPDGSGVIMAARATELVGGSDEVAASCIVLAAELLESLHLRGA